jgi:hypothetical protein
MKAIALKTFVGLLGAFAAYYACFLGSGFYELYESSARFCGTAQVWALQGGACHFDIVRTGQSRHFCSDVMIPNHAPIAALLLRSAAAR